MRVNVTRKTFLAITPTNSELKQIQKNLLYASSLISGSLSFSMARSSGDPTDWSTVCHRLMDYSNALETLLNKGCEEVGQSFSSPEASNAVGPQIVHTTHSMHHGMAKCGLEGKPHEWPEGHTQGQTGDVITCYMCIMKMTDALSKKLK